jgi:hypothetical protein
MPYLTPTPVSPRTEIFPVHGGLFDEFRPRGSRELVTTGNVTNSPISLAPHIIPFPPSITLGSRLTEKLRKQRVQVLPGSRTEEQGMGQGRAGAHRINLCKEIYPGLLKWNRPGLAELSTAERPPGVSTRPKFTIPVSPASIRTCTWPRPFISSTHSSTGPTSRPGSCVEEEARIRINSPNALPALPAVTHLELSFPDFFVLADSLAIIEFERHVRCGWLDGECLIPMRPATS